MTAEQVANQIADQGNKWIDVLLAFLDWPFLLFIFLTVFILVFKAKVMGLLERGDIQISWGENRHIKLKELSDGFDQEIDPIKEEIQDLREQIGKLSSVSPQGTKTPFTQHGLNKNQRKDAEEKILNALRDHKYRWRSVERLAILSGLSESDALDILRADQDIVLSIGKSKQQIARLKGR